MIKVYNMDVREGLRQLQDESVNCVITSPPYWALRDYGFQGQVGLESTFQEYITKLCNIFDEVKRVLRKDGTLWVNLGDTYNSHSTGKGNVGGIEKENKHLCDIQAGNNKRIELPDKSLCNIPARFSIEMQNRGWILRNVIIWHKPNCMPCSVKDRFTVDFEYVFFFVKSKKYWFETQYERLSGTCGISTGHGNGKTGKSLRFGCSKYGNDRNKRAVWTITTKPFRESHFAVFPEDLIIPMIKAGCHKNGVVLDIFAGSGTTLKVARDLNRNSIGIELNPEYIKIIKKRLYNNNEPLFDEFEVLI